MSDISKVFVIGRLTRDMELRFTQGGTAVAKSSIAVNRYAKDGEEVSFFDVTIWGKQAESLKDYLTKGKQVAIEGELRQERWEKDGDKRSRVEIVARQVQLLGGRDDKAEPKRQEKTRGPENFEDDIPF